MSEPHSETDRTSTRNIGLWLLFLFAVAAVLAFQGSESLKRRALAVPTAAFQAIDSAELRQHDVIAVPLDWSSAATVTLPDVWGYRNPGAGSQVWYRLELPTVPSDPTKDRISPRPTWVLIDRVRSMVHAYVDGRLIWEGGPITDPVQRLPNSPILLALPPPVGHDDSATTLLVRVAAAPGERGGLGRVYVGEHAVLRGLLDSGRFWHVEAVYITSAIITVTAIYILMLWRQTRGNATGYLALASAGFIWGLRNVNLTRWSPATGPQWLEWLGGLLASCGSGWFIACLGLFLAPNYVAPAMPRLARYITWAIWPFMLLGPILLLSPMARAEALALWLGLALPLLLAMAFGLAVFVWRNPSGTHFAFLALYLLLISLNVYDNATLRSPTRFGDMYLNHFGGVAFFILTTQLLVSRYGDLLRDFRRLNATLESRLSDRERELAIRHRELSRLEADRAQLEERGRIMRDLHDGLGSQLTLALLQSRVPATVEPAAKLEGLLQDCLDELRLAIYSLEPTASHAATVLGTWRQRVASSIESAGLKLVWAVDDVGEAGLLVQSEVLAVLRIVQEATNNALRHARASTLSLSLKATDRGLLIELTDDGCGPPVSTLSGHGLQNMHRRADDIGACLTIEAAHPGTRLRLLLPRPVAAPNPEAT